jgi:HEAT repeat protein
MILSELIQRLSAEDLELRLKAVAQLVSLGPVATPALLEAAASSTVATRVHAVQALGKLRDPLGLAVVISALGESENRSAVAIAAERALVEWGARCLPSVSYQALHGAATARPRSVRVLGRIGGAALRPLLVRLLGDALETVRLQAAEALAAIDPDAAHLELPALLDDQTDFVRLGVAAALVTVGSELGEPVLAAALKEEETHQWAEHLLEQLATARREGKLRS